MEEWAKKKKSFCLQTCINHHTADMGSCFIYLNHEQVRNILLFHLSNNYLFIRLPLGKYLPPPLKRNNTKGVLLAKMGAIAGHPNLLFILKALNTDRLQLCFARHHRVSPLSS